MRFFGPPWTLVPLIPLALLPPYMGLFANAIISLVSMAHITRRLDLGLWGFFFVAISPMHLQSMVFGNIEWLPLLGLLFPPPWALLFFLTKPQATIGLIILMLVSQWRELHWRGLILTLGPAVLLTALSLWLWGVPPTIDLANNPGQRSLFPYSLILGIPALIFALKKNDERWAALVGPFVSPYVTFHGYLPALFPFRGKSLALVVALAFVPVLLGLVT